MKILWLINIPLPEASALLNEKPSPFGGWLISASKELARQKGIDLTIAFPKKGVSKSIKIKGDKITYFAFKPVKSRDKILIKENFILKDIISNVKPDLVHIYGTELAHTLSMVNICKKENVKTIITVQGLVSIIEKHMFASLPFDIIYKSTIRNFLRRDNISGLRKQFIRRGKNEIEAIKKTDHIIGRTTWDKACVDQINPQAQYHFCNETLREEFYKHKWNIERCEKHSIFLSQGQYPIKGLHYVIEAMPIILNKYPDAKVYISGKDITKSDTIKDTLLITYYGKYIKRKIKKLGIESNVIFTGPLDEKEMCERFLKTHIFVSPSSIENESNSLSEAKILGVPSIASYVGGVIDRLINTKDGFLYQHDAPYMLAHYACEIFGNKNLTIKLSENARKHALQTHDKEINLNSLLKIYDEICNDAELC